MPILVHARRKSASRIRWVRNVQHHMHGHIGDGPLTRCGRYHRIGEKHTYLLEEWAYRAYGTKNSWMEDAVNYYNPLLPLLLAYFRDWMPGTKSGTENLQMVKMTALLSILSLARQSVNEICLSREVLPLFNMIATTGVGIVL